MCSWGTGAGTWRGTSVVDDEVGEAVGGADGASNLTINNPRSVLCIWAVSV